MYFVKVTANRAELYKTNGSRIRQICTDAVSADINESLELVVVTTTKNRVDLYKMNSGRIRTFPLNDAVNAKWSGNEIVITTQKGYNDLYNVNGSRIRRLF